MRVHLSLLAAFGLLLLAPPASAGCTTTYSGDTLINAGNFGAAQGALTLAFVADPVGVLPAYPPGTVANALALEGDQATDTNAYVACVV